MAPPPFAPSAPRSWATSTSRVAPNSWQLAEQVGHGSAYRLEWLLNEAQWDADVLRGPVHSPFSGQAGMVVG